MRVKSSGIAVGLANAWPPGSTKLAIASLTPGNEKANAPQ